MLFRRSAKVQRYARAPDSARDDRGCYWYAPHNFKLVHSKLILAGSAFPYSVHNYVVHS
jgi:hypothetical protein